MPPNFQLHVSGVVPQRIAQAGASHINQAFPKSFCDRLSLVSLLGMP